MSRGMKSRMKGKLSGCRTNARRGSAVMWFMTCWASRPHLSPPPRKQRSKTRRKRK